MALLKADVVAAFDRFSPDGAAIAADAALQKALQDGSSVRPREGHQLVLMIPSERRERGDKLFDRLTQFHKIGEYFDMPSFIA